MLSGGEETENHESARGGLQREEGYLTKRARKWNLTKGKQRTKYRSVTKAVRCGGQKWSKGGSSTGKKLQKNQTSVTLSNLEVNKYRLCGSVWAYRQHGSLNVERGTCSVVNSIGRRDVSEENGGTKRDIQR